MARALGRPLPFAEQTDTTTLRVQTARLVARVRWAAVALGIVQAFLTTDPRPVGGAAGMLAGAGVMLGYNLAVAWIDRLPSRAREAVVAAALAGDLGVVTLWTLLTANDVWSTSYAAFGLVAIEAAALYRRRGVLAFLVAFAAVEALIYSVRWSVFGFAPQPGSVLYRVGIVLLAAVFTGGIAEQSEERRVRLLQAGERYVDLHRDVQRQASRHEQLLQSISDVGEGILITEAGRLVHCNDAYRELTGYTDAELRALPSLIELAPEPSRAELARRLADRLAGEAVPLRYDSQLVTRDGRIVDVETAVRRLPHEGSSRLIAVVRDVTERRRAEAALEESEQRARSAARTDPLTGVPNRRAWDEALEAAMASASGSASGSGSTPLTVALLDLDGFKAFNDDWGHQRGDEELRAFAARWGFALRSCDLLARLGGDEFAVLLPGATADDARGVVERLRIEMTSQQTFSVGIATWNGVESADSLLSRADAALYDSKRRGGGRVVGVASGTTLADWTVRVRDLISRGAVRAAFQPIRRLADRSVIGYEALARPLGFGATDSVEELFAAAKRVGHTRDLDWLCRRAALGTREIPAGTLIFVNVSVHALLDPLHDVDQMELLLSWAGRNPEDVVLEISERDPINDLRRLERVLASYRAAGFRFAIDDIGEGHSTFEVLATAVPEYVKVAHSLTARALQAGPEAAVRALVQFCASSGTQLIAEGLESELHVRLMASLGVELGQGHALGAPRLHRGDFVPHVVEPVA